MTIAEWAANRRVTRGLTQEEVARELQARGVGSGSKQTYSNKERGLRRFDAAEVRALLDLFEIHDEREQLKVWEIFASEGPSRNDPDTLAGEAA